MLGNFKDSVKEFSEGVKSAVTEKELDEETLDPLIEDLRLKLLQNNVSLEAVESINKRLKKELLGEDIKRGSAEEKVRSALKEILKEILDDEFELIKKLEDVNSPPTIFLIGFNGSGKTTSAAKLSKFLMQKDKDVVLGAGDTFRAASIEQLETHGENLGVEVISHEYESDPAAVAYDTVEHAEKENKTAIVDTAGRSHSDRNLMNELDKMIRVNEPDITFLVLDALAGNDVIEQAEAYEGMFDAVIITKMDIDEDGGALISIAEKSRKPIAFIGTGQDYSDLEKFNKEEFIDNLLD